MIVRSTLAVVLLLVSMGPARAQTPDPAGALSAAETYVRMGDWTAAEAVLANHTDGKAIAYREAIRAVHALSRDLVSLYERAGKDGVQQIIENVRGLEEVRRDPYLSSELRSVERRLAALHESRVSLGERLYATGRALLPSGLVLLQTGLGLAVIAVLLGVMRLVKKHRTKKNRKAEIAIVDPSGGKAGPDPVLGAQLVARLRTLVAAPQRKTATLDQDSELGEMLPQWEPSFSSELQSVSARLDEGESLKIGAVRVPIKPLLDGIRRAFGQERFLWAGELVRSANGARLMIAETDRVTKAKRTWTATTTLTDDAQATRELLDEIAVQMSLGVQDDPITVSAEAYLAYQRSLEMMDDVYESNDRTRTLEEAKKLLMEALRADPALWRARFRLGIILRKLGDRERAAAIFAELRGEKLGEDDVLELDWHVAVLEAQYRSLDRLLEARRKLAELRRKLEKRTPAPTLLLHCRSFDAAIAAELFAWEDEEFKLDVKLVERLEFTIRREMEFFSEPAADGVDRRVWNACRAFVLRAEGKRQIRRGSFEEGMALLEKALVCLPDLRAALVELGSAHRRRKQATGEEGVTWFDEAERAFQEALRLDENDPRANLEYARALLETKPPQLEQAIRCLERAAKRRASARYELGKIRARKQARIDEGISLIWQAIEMLGERAPHWYAEEISDIVHTLPAGERTAERVEMANAAYSWLLAQKARMLVAEAVPEPIVDDGDARIDVREAVVRRVDKAVGRVSAQVASMKTARG